MSTVGVVRKPSLFGAEVQDESGSTVFLFDATISEGHSHMAEPTTHPIEEGADITDHVRIKPRSLSLTGIVTNTPFEEFEVVPDRDILAFEDLVAILEKGEPVTVVTPLFVYENMVLTDCTVSRDGSTGQAIAPSLTFNEVSFAEQREVALPREKIKKGSKASGGASQSNAGQQQATDANQTQAQAASEPPKSWASSIGDNLFG